MKTILSFQEFEEVCKTEQIVLFYFSHHQCSVCKVLKPKLEAAVKEQYPEVKSYYIQTDVLPEVAAQNSVFTVPTVLIFVHGKESYRHSRSFSVDVVLNDLDRPYQLLF